MDASSECQAFVEKIFASIKKNIKSLTDEKALQGLLESIHKFYASLFAKNSGIFTSKGMERGLRKLPKLSVKAREEERTEGGASKSIGGKKERAKGLGKGIPGGKRKPVVTKRQERRRADPKFTAKKRSLSSESSTKEQPPPKRIATKPTQSTSTEDTPGPSTNPSTTSTTPSRTTPERPDEPPEAREELRAQTFEAPVKSQVRLIQDFAEAEKDSAPNGRELEIFWRVMDYWKMLDRDFVDALQTWWCKLTLDKDQSIEEKILLMTASPNGVSNCLHHLTGNLLYEHAKKLGKLNETTAFFEDLEEKFKELHYVKYVEALQSCYCEECESVLQFDDAYARYHDSLESENHEEFIDEPVRMKDRPRHCGGTEVIAQSLRAQFAGFSVSNLQRWYHFSAATPRFSPPTLSLASPSTVSATSLKYLEPYLKERKLTDPLPSSWKIPKAIPTDHDLLRVRKESIHVCDGDSCEITLSPDDQGTDLANLATHGNTIRIRMPHSDSPETEYAVRIYKQSEESTNLSTFLTRHIGIECLRATREMVYEASNVFLQVKRDFRGRLSVPQDPYGRRLAHVVLENSDGLKENLAEKLASRGFTLSFYTTGIDLAIDAAMRKAVDEKKGIFSLPDEAFTYPYRPWEVRKLTTTGHTGDYDEYKEILNKPMDPNFAWIARESSAPLDGGEEDGSVPESETTDNFYLRLVPSKLYWESKCFVAQSTIPGAGRGLFVQPHKDEIPVGEHLCIYAEQSTTIDGINASGSSRVYAIYSSRKKLWFDAEIQTGNNLGRFANQPGVLEALQHVKEMSAKDNAQMTVADWRNVERELDEKCNAQFETVADQMVLKVKQPFVQTYEKVEVFVNYGGLREYWIPLIVENQSKNLLPQQMTEIVRWLNESPDCNWTADQRNDWISTARENVAL